MKILEADAKCIIRHDDSLPSPDLGRNLHVRRVGWLPQWQDHLTRGVCQRGGHLQRQLQMVIARCICLVCAIPTYSRHLHAIIEASTCIFICIWFRYPSTYLVLLDIIEHTFPCFAIV
jgi:hypothetical protein